MISISFVIPVYQNEGSIKCTFDEISKLELFKSRKAECYFVFINDGSKDKSEIEVKEIVANNRNAKLISFSRNFGQVAAITAGLRAASGDCSIVLSADGQDPIHKIDEIIDHWQNGSEIVIATRENRDDSLISMFTSKLFYGLMNLINPDMPKGGFDFFLLDQKVRTLFNEIKESNRFLQGDVLWLGFNTKLIKYTRIKRIVGQSQWTFGKKLKYLIDGFLTTSYLPIRFISFMGIVFSNIGLIYALVIIYNWYMNETPFSGWAPLMIVVLISSGFIMIMLGIIGEYLWRTYDETRKRPQYIIKEIVENS